MFSKEKLAALIDHTSEKLVHIDSDELPEQNGFSTQLEEYYPLPFNIIKAKRKMPPFKANIFLFLFSSTLHILCHIHLCHRLPTALCYFFLLPNAADLTQIYAGQSFSVLMAGYSFFHQSCYNSVLPLSLHFADTLRSHKTSASFQEADFPVLWFCYDLYRIQIFLDLLLNSFVKTIIYIVHHQFPIFVQYDPCCVETISRMLHQEEFFSIYDDTVKGKASFLLFLRYENLWYQRILEHWKNRFG